MEYAPLSRRRVGAEILIVLGLSLGASAVYSVVSIINRLTRDIPLGEQTATLNQSMSTRPVFDLIYQLLSIGFDLVPVALVAFILWQQRRPHLAGLGVDLRHPARDVGAGLALAAIIGLPGLLLYLGSRSWGIAVAVQASALDTHWWTVPILVLSALRAGLTEEVVVIGYLFARLPVLGWSRWQIIVGCALLRGTYHLYQGFGAFVGNAAMGLLFGWLFARYGRLVPLIVAHVLIDVAVFVGYPWAAETFPALFA